MNYKRAEALYNNRKTGKDFVTLEHKTVLRLNKDDPYKSYSIIYHYTPVVTVHQDDTFTLRAGGHYTNTTKQRIKIYSPANLFQLKGDWFLDTYESRTPFFENMLISSTGVPIK